MATLLFPSQAKAFRDVLDTSLSLSYPTPSSSGYTPLSPALLRVPWIIAAAPSCCAHPESRPIWEPVCGFESLSQSPSSLCSPCFRPAFQLNPSPYLMAHFPATLPYLTLSPYFLNFCLHEPPCSSSTLHLRHLCISFSFFRFCVSCCLCPENYFLRYCLLTIGLYVNIMSPF